MRTAPTVLALAAACLFSLPPAAVADAHMEAAAAPAPAAKSLYERLGGYDAIAAVTDDFVGRLAGDPALAKFFVGHSTDSLTRIRQHIVDQLCAATGGPCKYTGRDMKTTHAGLAITEEEWGKAAAHLLATFDKFKVPEQERTEVLALVSSLHDDIVEKPAAK